MIGVLILDGGAGDVAEAGDGAGFVGSHFGAQKIGDGDCGDDQNYRDEGDAYVAENHSCERHASALQTAGAFANLRAGNVAEDYGKHCSGEDEEQEPAD